MLFQAVNSGRAYCLSCVANDRATEPTRNHGLRYIDLLRMANDTGEAELWSCGSCSRVITIEPHPESNPAMPDNGGALLL